MSMNNNLTHLKIKLQKQQKINIFYPDPERKIICDESQKSCAIEQRTPDGWLTVAFAPRFLNSVEDRYSIIELELLGVVWSIEHFKYYLYGKPYTVVRDYRARLFLKRENSANKSHNSGLT